ncbi:CoB--CoM heterodisulfide reductase iron-sulfur subunit B family protein [Desulfoluna sp.]|uniref:CoB--CoM heterodisulfide reductase iron-sulfur subunit B family protein n=1 Tax=Desulfoluna sp. TaxID=2045199 RepID=UPI00261BD9C9|nr:CoB--CoM heterodisulfide reductase iron-sulfur subunit B family protein [Desulfoluna sp.]
MDLAYYPGCSLHQSSQFYDHQTRLVFSTLGIDLKEINDWSCCGATSAGKFDDFLAVALPARNLGIAETSGYHEMVVPCSGCYSSLLMSQVRLKENPSLLSEINRDLTAKVDGSLKLLTILEVLLRATAEAGVKERVVHPLKGLKAACYYGCMTRFAYDVPVSDNVENPRGMETLVEFFGAETMDWSYKTACCGASAAINDPDTAFRLMAKIMKDALARKANCIVTTCPMCQLNLDAYQERFCNAHGIYERLPVYFITELAGLALGLPIESLNMKQHFVDVTGLINETRIADDTLTP